MKLTHRTSLRALTATACAVGAFVALQPGSELAHASTNAYVQDSDGDLLPDALEWALLTDARQRDSDADGAEDVIEALLHEHMRTAPVLPRPMDHELRAAVAVHRDATGQAHVLLHVVARIALSTSGLASIKGLAPFVDYRGTRLPIDRLVAGGIINITRRFDPVEGLFVVISSRIASVENLKLLTPCTVGVTASIGQKAFESGMLVDEVDDELVVIAPIDDNRYVIHPLDPQFPQIVGPGAGSGSSSGQKFWSQAKVCELDLSPVGSGGGITVVQVNDANCVSVSTLFCASSCLSQNGRLYVLPYGPGLLNGR